MKEPSHRCGRATCRWSVEFFILVPFRSYLSYLRPRNFLVVERPGCLTDLYCDHGILTGPLIVKSQSYGPVHEQINLDFIVFAFKNIWEKKKVFILALRMIKRGCDRCCGDGVM